MRKQQQRDQRPSNRAGRIHGLNQPVRRADARCVDRLGDHHIARRFRECLLQKRSAKRIARICHHEVTSASSGFTALATTVSADHERLAARNPVGQIAGEKLGERRDALGDAFDDAELRGPRAERGQERRQHPVRHLAGRVIEERGEAEGVDVARGGCFSGSGTSIILFFR